MTDWGDCENGDQDDEALAGDFVGTISARLLAAGLPRDQRLGALRLLSALDTLADRDDRVRRPLRQVGAEFDLPSEEVDPWFDALEWVGAVVHVEGGIVLMGREHPAGSMRLHDFLAVVADLDDHPLRHRPAPAVLRPAAAVLVAAALIAAVLLAPGVVRNGTSNEPTNLAAPTGGTVTTGGRTANGSETTAGTARTGVITTSLLPPTIASRTPLCPTGTPSIDVVQVVSGATTTVSGVIRNSAAEPVAITAFTVIASVNGQEVPGVPGTVDPIEIPGGGSATWVASLPATAATGTNVRTTLDRWEWRGAAAGCPAT